MSCTDITAVTKSINADHALQTRRQNSRKINNAYNKNAYDFKRAQNKRV